MKKIIIATLLSMSMFTMFAGCGSSSSSSASNEPVKLEASEYADLSEDLFSYEIKLDGVKYTLPADYSEFNSNGWALSDEDSQKTVASGLYLQDRFDLTKDEKKIKSQIMNAGTGASDKLTDCKVGMISVYSTDKTSIILPQGITIGSSIDDLKAAYGEPSDIKTYDDKSLKDSQLYKYYAPEYDNSVLCSVWIGVDTKTNKVTSISITNLSY